MALFDRYIYFYNHECIQLKTGVAPLPLRHSDYNSIFPTEVCCDVRTNWGSSRDTCY